MKKMTISRIAVAASVLVLLALAVQPVEAACTNARLITGFNVSTSERSYIITPGVCPGGGGSCGAPYYSSVTGNIRGDFWGIGSGDPFAPLSGIDNGLFDTGSYPPPYQYQLDPYNGWLTGSFFYPAEINTTWAASSLIDGCPDTIVGTQCTAVLLNDHFGGQSFFALITKRADAGLNYVFTRPGGAPINLAPIPNVGITGSTRLGPSQVQLTVAPPFGSSPGPAEGFYLDSACSGVGTPTGWRVRSQSAPGHGNASPTDRDVADWGTSLGTATNFGSSQTVTASCTGDQDIWLAYTILYDSGLELSYVGGNSSRVECGANLAEPDDRPTGPQIVPDRIRRTPSGRRGN
jgi:hypothetical protein